MVPPPPRARKSTSDNVQGAREPRPSVETFAEAGLPPALVKALSRRGVDAPFPIQAAVLPDALAGEHILARAQTGSGKTLGFGLPMLTELAHLRDMHGKTEKHEPRGLVLVPTRELAHQVLRELGPLADALDISATVVTGGAPYRPQQDALRRRVDLVVATPGRLIDLVERGDCYLDSVAITVLDEADHMCDLGFLEPMVEILTAVPEDGQRMLFSATLDKGVDVLVRQFLPDPVLVAVDSESAPVEAANHYVFNVNDWRRKRPLVAALANGSGRTLIFGRTQLGVDRVTEELAEVGIKSEALHGGMSQGARTRALKNFMTGRVRVLVATDVAARGIHVDDIDVVIQADPTTEAKTYLHRSGRTARAGNGGTVVSVVMPRERRAFEKLLQEVKVTATVATSTDDNPDVEALVGPPAPPIEFKPERYDRDDRGNRGRRPHRDDRSHRDDRPRRDDRSRDDRPRDDRPHRDDRPYRDDRPRDDRPHRDDRPRSEGQRSGSYDRRDKPTGSGKPGGGYKGKNADAGTSGGYKGKSSGGYKGKSSDGGSSGGYKSKPGGAYKGKTGGKPAGKPRGDR